MPTPPPSQHLTRPPGPTVFTIVRAAFDGAAIPYRVDGQPSIDYQAVIVELENLAHPGVNDIPEIRVTDNNSSMRYGEKDFHGLWAVLYQSYDDDGQDVFQSSDFGETGDGRARLRADLDALITVVSGLRSRTA
ncbi:hypothetical protein ACIQF6_28870 [Kitasatospora sp. NPDC092948]|uniref:hypothetical protein n=1 Tax=Kitasatospora sp. NPDC092948 TaxID=3364088 RepID=UPI003814F4A3